MSAAEAFVTNEQDRSERLPALRPTCESPDYWREISSLRENVAARAASSRLAHTELELGLAKVRKSYTDLLMLLKALELERIDLQAVAQGLASTRQNWRSRQGDGKLRLELDQRLAEEERMAVAEVQSATTNIALVSAKASRLREVRDAIEQRLTQKKSRMQIEGTIVAECHHMIERAQTSRDKFRIGSKNIRGCSGVDKMPHRERLNEAELPRTPRTAR